MTKSVLSLNLGELFSLKLCSRAPRFTGELLPPPHPFSFFPVNLMLISCAYPIRAANYSRTKFQITTSSP